MNLHEIVYYIGVGTISVFLVKFINWLTKSHNGLVVKNEQQKNQTKGQTTQWQNH